MTRRNPNPHAHESLRDAVDVTRFWSMVERGGPSDCWPWVGDRDSHGYGVFFWRGRRHGAHEIALSFATGEVRLSHLDTCHSCHRRECCNPSHLRFDSRASNVADMVRAGRAPCPNARLTPEQVVELRERRAAGARQSDLAKQYGITEGRVSVIVRGLAWRTAGGPIQERKSA